MRLCPPVLPAIDPMPAIVGSHVPWVGAAAGMLANPTAWFARQRARHGDTFAVDALAHRFFCVFGAEGVRQLYAVPEHKASFGLATYTMIRTKVPNELFGDIRNPPHKLFGNEQVEGYLGNLETAMTDEIDRLGRSGSFEVFAEARRIGHRLGLASWAGQEAASARYFERMVDALDRLDTAESFVHPLRTVVTVATHQRRERSAMHEIEAIVAEILGARRRSAVRPGDFLDRIDESFADVPAPLHDQLVARDVIVLHLGSQSNLFAALAWTLVRLVDDPTDLAAVRDGDRSLLERYAYESIRFAQRSITMRQVLRPLELDDGDRTYRLSPGVLITTMLSVTNTTALPELGTFDPQHYTGRRLALAGDLPAKELVSTFGHGIHTCPAQRFSISAITTAVTALIDRFDLAPRYTMPGPLTRQIGGVARADRACPVDFCVRPRPQG
ncbi:MAG: Cytochrome [Acidimicrobiales bacterium]|nr:Cytochrome [Acidimicrobiales bacterium]